MKYAVRTQCNSRKTQQRGRRVEPVNVNSESNLQCLDVSRLRTNVNRCVSIHYAKKMRHVFETDCNAAFGWPTIGIGNV